MRIASHNCELRECTQAALGSTPARMAQEFGTKSKCYIASSVSVQIPFSRFVRTEVKGEFSGRFHLGRNSLRSIHMDSRKNETTGG